MKSLALSVALFAFTHSLITAETVSLYQPVSPEESGIHFLHPFLEDHPQAYLYHSGYAVGGISLGDVNGDGMLDIFIVSGPGKNQLFIQQDNNSYRQASAPKLEGTATWGTNARLVDIDNDGDLDLYQCNYDASNQLFLNNGKGNFTEVKGAAGLDVHDASMSASFADIDNDGDLDMFLQCNRYYRPKGRPKKPPFVMKAGLPVILPEYQKYYRIITNDTGAYHIDDYGRADYLFLNQGNDTHGIPRFKDISQASGIQLIGYGLSSVWWDFDSDGDLDLYVANDFTDEDRLFRNDGINQDGIPHFTNVIANHFPHTSWSSMGSDSADINHDGRPDLMTLDMSATSHFKSKMNMGEMNGPSRKTMEFGWPRQSMRNHLFINTGRSMFQETAFASGLYSSDWSWTVKFGDLDNDGFQDVFISNGIARNFTHSDKNLAIGDKKMARIGHTLWDLHKDTPPMPEKNLVFQNLDGHHFKKRTDWGLGLLGMSYSAAMGDLDNDGDLDLVVSDLGKVVKIYKNQGAVGKSLRVKLTGTQSNRMGIGAKVVVTDSEGQKRTRWMNPWSGFQSQNDTTLHIGLGEATPTQVCIYWPSGIYQERTLQKGCQEISIIEKSSGKAPLDPTPQARFTATTAPPFSHREKIFDDFKRQPLLPSKHSQDGPCLAKGDVDGDGDDDLFIGGGNGQKGVLMLNDKGMFTPYKKDFLSGLAAYTDDTAALWFDADGDKDLDLLVVSGGSEYEPDDMIYRDHLYLNESINGEIKLVESPDGAFPRLSDAGSCVVAADYDADGDLDLFIGSRLVPGKYPSLPKNRLLRNDSKNGKVKFTEVTPLSLKNCGMVTDAVWKDLDADGDPDLALSIDWGAITIFQNNHGELTNITPQAGTSKLKGWWRSLHAVDLDGDGDLDIIAGNAGINTKYKKPSTEKPDMIYYGDMDGTATPRIVEAKIAKDVHNRERPLPVRGRS